MITVMNESIPREEQIAANMGTQIVGLCTFISGIGASVVVSKFKRRDLFLIGQALIAILLGVFSYSIYHRLATQAIVVMGMCIFAVNLTVGGLHWLYMPEITSDVQFGFVATFHYSNGIIIATISEPMFKYLRPEGTFLFHCICSTLGWIFMFFYLKETDGLTDKQKKELYIPKEYIGINDDLPNDGEREIELSVFEDDVTPKREKKP